MLVLHGFWSTSNGLCLWAEDSTLTVTSPSDALRTARPHPFAAAADAIAPIHAGKPGTAVLLLPSLRKSPLDSPELFRVTPRPAPRIEPVLLPWTIPVMFLPAASALTALGEPAADVRYGASVAYLADLAAFALDLVQRGRVLPALSSDEHGPVAFWRPVVQGPDIVALNSLIAAMPPVCRAESDAQDGHELATSALCAFADAWVRTRLPAGIELPPRRGRRPKHVPAQEAWLTALTAPDGRFDADPGELDDLAEALQPWDAIGADEPGPARAMFRLTETEEPDGQQPEDLLANVQAARSKGRPAADRAEPPGRPLTDCLDSYFIRQADVPSPSPRVTSSTALLDQLPDVVVGVRGQLLVEILRPAYAALGEGEGGR